MKIVYCAYGKPGIGCILELLIRDDIQKKDLLVFTYKRDDNLELLNFLKNEDIKTIYKNINSCYTAVSEFKPDYIISVFYRHIIKKAILDLSPQTMNTHQSLLPLYRGRFATFWMIFNGDREVGVTHHQMIEKVDEGNIILQRKIRTDENETAHSLYYKLANLCITTFNDAFTLLINGNSGYPQNDLPKSDKVLAWKSNDFPMGGKFHLNKSNLIEAERFLRAMYFPPKPPALLIFPDGSYTKANLLSLARLEELAEA